MRSQTALKSLAQMCLADEHSQHVTYNEIPIGLTVAIVHQTKCYQFKAEPLICFCSPVRLPHYHRNLKQYQTVKYNESYRLIFESCCHICSTETVSI